MAGNTKGGIKRIAASIGMSADEYMARCATGEKFCWRCRAWHPRSEFGKDSTRTDGLEASCRSSRNKATRGNYEAKPAASRIGMYMRPTIDGSKRQARERVTLAVRNGKLSKARDLPCADCGHAWEAGDPPDRRHEWHHHNGYGSEHQLDVIALCMLCHRHRDQPKGALTHCHKGHEFSVENTYVARNGDRLCRSCRRAHDSNRRDAAWWRAWRARKKVLV